MNKIFCAAIISLLAISLQAQPVNEKNAVKSLCGCFEVDFKYAETFGADTTYKFHPAYHTSGLEWVVADEQTDKKMVLQHLLVISDSMVIKHWREDWEYEKADWWLFNHDATWKHVAGDKQKVKGEWTQTVWEVDDAPRYQGSGKWVNSNGKYYWENTTDAPLPRREYTKRKDYNVMQRTNRIVIADTGWVHEQDNKKIIRKDGGADVYVAEEKGYNIYRKTDDSKCKQAATWWKNHQIFWGTVRQSWETAMKDKTTIHLISKADGKLMYQQLDVLEQQTLTTGLLKEKLSEVLAKYMVNHSSKDAAVK